MIWKFFYRCGIPDYLARHYWWAYLWRPGIWFFDHETIINSILFRQYENLSNITVEKIANLTPGSRILQLSCVYGSLSPGLHHCVHNSYLYIADVSWRQLNKTKLKMQHNSILPLYCQINSEKTAYADNSFDTVLIYFLLHEMPPEARKNTLMESFRILKPGGKLIITEYGELTNTHLLHKNRLLRNSIEFLEPYLLSFWTDKLQTNLEAVSAQTDKNIKSFQTTLIYDDFYRIVECVLEG